MADATPGRLQINGTVAPGFEPVRQKYEQLMQRMAERHTQLCIYHRGVKVVDLWASTDNGANYSADSLANVFSSGKSLEAIAIGWLVNKGLIRYDALITEYWPEFGANGKDGLTVADLMRHEAGLANFDTSIDMEDLFTANIKQNAIGRIIEQNAATYAEPDRSRREYHALTRGWIVNEVFRRVDPAGRTIGEFLREDLSGPLQADVHIGVTTENLPRITQVKTLGFGYQLLQSLKPRFLGRRIVHNIFQILGRLFKVIPSVMRARKAKLPPPFVGSGGMGFFHEPKWPLGETPSANATCSARGLAKIAAMMANRGRWEGREYLGEPAWQAMHDNPKRASMGRLLNTNFTQGGVDCFTATTADSVQTDRDFNDGREGYFGWLGLGGSIFQWHPEHDIGFAFVPTALHVLDFFNERGKDLQAETLKCVEQLEAEGATASASAAA